MASAAGVYNGLFFQTNADGAPAMTEGTAGFMGNCVVSRNGTFSAQISLSGATYRFASVFDVGGNAAATISRNGASLSNLTAELHLDLIRGTGQMTGAISSTIAGKAWSAPLVADFATNAFPQLSGVYLCMSPELSPTSPSNSGAGIGVVLNGVLTLSGFLGDSAALAQTVPISGHGTVPLYVNLYNNSGLLEGWLSLAGGLVTGHLTWIRPSGILLPPGFPQGFDTVVQVSGTTASQ